MLLAVLAGACSRDSAAATLKPRDAASADSAQRTVLVELFTSEGCSSCPPADALVADLIDDDLDVAVVAFHVDYWNYLGWSDRFSSERWSERQRSYAEAMATSRIYTPQLLFDGRDHRVGVRSSRVREAIAAAAAQTTDTEIAVQAERTDRGVDVAVLVADAPGASAASTVMVALVADKESTQVRRGENAGRTLGHRSVALDLVEACRVRGAGQTSCEASFDLDADAPDGLGVVAFVQSPRAMKVLAAARTSL